MNGQQGRLDGKPYNKVPFASDILLVEKMDLLLLTETHGTALGFPTSRQTTILAESIAPHPPGQRPRAGLALLAINDGSWTCTSFTDLIPGYAFLVRLHHSRSTESFYLLAVYVTGQPYCGPK